MLSLENVSDSTQQSDSLSVVGLGEALFDCFDERVLLGGAPVNLAYHAHQLLSARHGRGIVVSCVGQDDLGERLKNELHSRSMTSDFLQVSAQFPTGTVQVEVDGAGQPHYTIVPDVAWDHLDFTPELADLAANCSAVCYGTLAQRSPQTQTTVQQFLAAAKHSLRICDINLRQQFFDANVLEFSLRSAHVAKLNEHELTEIGELLDLGRQDASRDERAQEFIRKFDLRLLALTRGERGTALYTPDEMIAGDPVSYPRKPNADSVGAGDACCAAIIAGLLLDKPLSAVVDLANRVGAFVASVQGATPVLPDEILAML